MLGRPWLTRAPSPIKGPQRRRAPPSPDRPHRSLMAVDPHLLANAIRALAMDAVEAANSGHPGMPMGMADVATLLWTEYLKHDPADPSWPDRDRFVLSAGHGSMLIYALLHLTGYARPTIEDIKGFRKLGSPCAGHPENFLLDGVEATTGPAGTGRRHGGRHGDRRAAPQRRIWRRPGRSPHLGDRRRRLPDGGDQPRGGGPRRPSRPRPPDRLLGRQPDHHRRLDRAFDLGGYRGALRGLWLARRALRRPRPGRRPPRHRRGAGRSAPLADRLPDDHRQGRAEQAGHRRDPRRRIGRRRGRRRPRDARLGPSAVRAPRRTGSCLA